MSRPSLRLLPSLCLITVLLSGCSANSVASMGFAAHTPAGTQRGSERYQRLASQFLAGEDVDIGQLRNAWLETPDLTTRSDLLARAGSSDDPRVLGARLNLYAADLLALNAGAAASDDPMQSERILERALNAILDSGDGSPEAPWQVNSRGDAIAVLRLLDLEVVGGYYHLADAHPLTLRLITRPSASTPGRKWVFDLSDVFWAHHAERTQRRPGTRYTPLHRVQELARHGDHDAITSTAVLTLESDTPGARQAAAERLFEAARAGNHLAEALLADQFWALAGETDGERSEAALLQAERGYRRAAAGGYVYGSYRLGHLLVTRGDVAAGVALLEEAAALDDAQALRMLAALHRDGEHLPADAERTRELYRRLHALGDVDGRYSYAHWALTPPATVEDPLAMEALLANVASGDAESIGLKGDLHALGRHFPEDHERALALWREASRRADDLGHVQQLAHALVHNPASLRDAAFAAELLESWLARAGRHEQCSACYVTWAEALLASGRPVDAVKAASAGLAGFETGGDEHPGRERLLALQRSLAAGGTLPRSAQDVAARSGQRTPVPPSPQ